MDEGKVILVTGCSTGIGRAVAESLAQKGHTVFATMRATEGRNAAHAEALREKAAAEGLALTVLELDVLRDDSVAAAVETVLARTGRIDVLLNNAGTMTIGVSEALTVAQLQAMLDVNVVGTFRVTQAVLPHMRRQRAGLLAYISSTGATFRYPFMGMYGATKSAMEAMAETLHGEVFSLGIDTVIFQAGLFATALGEHVGQAAHKDLWQEYGLSGQVGAGFAAQFPQSFTSPMATHPAVIADRLQELLDTPSGSRPLRVPIGAFSEGLLAINPTVEAVQGQALAALGFDVLFRRADPS